jgi:hypothetical protein
MALLLVRTDCALVCISELILLAGPGRAEPDLAVSLLSGGPVALPCWAENLTITFLFFRLSTCELRVFHPPLTLLLLFLCFFFKRKSNATLM